MKPQQVPLTLKRPVTKYIRATIAFIMASAPLFWLSPRPREPTPCLSPREDTTEARQGGGGDFCDCALGSVLWMVCCGCSFECCSVIFLCVFLSVLWLVLCVCSLSVLLWMVFCVCSFKSVLLWMMFYVCSLSVLFCSSKCSVNGVLWVFFCEWCFKCVLCEWGFVRVLYECPVRSVLFGVLLGECVLCSLSMFFCESTFVKASFWKVFCECFLWMFLCVLLWIVFCVFSEYSSVSVLFWMMFSDCSLWMFFWKCSMNDLCGCAFRSVFV